MRNIYHQFKNGAQDDYQDLKTQISRYLDQLGDLKKILIIPPDYTRKHSQAGIITRIIFDTLGKNVKIDILPALGTHRAMGESEIRDMFGEKIPKNLFIEHNWLNETKKIGKVPEEFMGEISEGQFKEGLDVELNQIILEGNYDRIISIGQVLPHEVVGMSNYTKNIIVGCGGRDFINKSHYLGAIYGLERLIGKDHSPVRKLYDYVEETMLINLPIDYILTVNEASISGKNSLSGLTGIFMGRGREVFEKAVSLSQKTNITYIDEPVKKFVTYLNHKEFNSLWLANKAIYRTRASIADRGELLVIAPGLKSVGENDLFDSLIRKYGYIGKEKIIKLVEENKELRENLAVPAHLIHGSPEGRFKVTYVSDQISKETINEVGFNHLSLRELEERFNFNELIPGWNVTGSGEKVYFIKDPATGLWVSKGHI